jgi:tetratricopeptide (TPR) repeat protein
MILVDAGIAFTFGPDIICNRLAHLRLGKHPIDRYCRNELMEQSVYLAPEQRTLGLLNEVGSAADYYSFGALALALFGHKRFISLKDVDWTQIPSKWHPFLKACLEEKASNRPRDFLEIEDRLLDPELALMHAEVSTFDSGKTSVALDADKEAEAEFNALTGLLRRSEGKISLKEPDTLKQHLDEGQKALKMAKWEFAKKAFKSALRIDPNHTVANLNLAIALYELGEFKASEKHVKAAQEIDASAAKRFRQHIAFRL